MDAIHNYVAGAGSPQAGSIFPRAWRRRRQCRAAGLSLARGPGAQARGMVQLTARQGVAGLFGSGLLARLFIFGFRGSGLAEFVANPWHELGRTESAILHEGRGRSVGATG